MKLKPHFKADTTIFIPCYNESDKIQLAYFDKFFGSNDSICFALSMMLVQMGHNECWKFLRAKQQALPTH